MAKQKTSSLSHIRDGLIKAGVKNLKAYGYPSCNAENILTDEIYKAFFRSMLPDNLGANEAIDHEIKKLMAEIDGK